MGDNHLAPLPSMAYGVILLASAIAYWLLQRRIIAADGPAAQGVAPKALIYAYKVLAASGSGYMSDIIAALERAGFQRIDYFEVRNADDLSHPGPGPLTVPGRVLAAAMIGKTRLIDNMAV